MATCKCCGRELTVVGVQTYPAKYNLKDKVLVECQNETCVMNRRTHSADFHEQACDEEIERGKVA